ncbi:MAG: hypothetical protein NTY20_02570 [Candidatus Aenigmarchaeota archaeon]|nr:hypothetical protein [Candidatus Aenigmarchaeota archaeon]
MESNKVPVNPFCERKKETLKKAFDIIMAITKSDEKIRYLKLKAVIIANFGLSEKKAVEYIKLFVDQEVIYIREGFVYLNPNLTHSHSSSNNTTN